MDAIDQAYAQMFQQTSPAGRTENVSVDNVETILTQIQMHIRYLADILPVQKRKKFVFLLAYSDDQFPKYSLICSNELTLTFTLYFANEQFIFQAIPATLDDYILKGKPNLSFYYGSIADPDTHNILHIYTKPVKFKAKFLADRKAALKRRDEMSNMSLFKPQEETMQTVWLQYANYFRNK